MFEIFDGRSFSVYDDSVNRNLFNWTAYENNVTLNSHGNYELSFNLSDGILLGTEETPLKLDQATSNYQLRLRVDLMKADAYISCLDEYYTASCAPLLSTLTEASNDLRLWSYYDFASKSKGQQ